MTVDRDQLTMEMIGGDNSELRTALVAARLPVDDLTGPGRTFFRFTDAGRTIGFGGLELFDGCTLLRSIVVPADQRGRGFGQEITRKLLDQAHGADASAVYLLTDGALPFFEALGFRAIARDAAPAAILGTRQAASLCSASAALMTKDLSA
jgi:amino-acid N-acetyltransferase